MMAVVVYAAVAVVVIFGDITAAVPPAVPIETNDGRALWHVLLPPPPPGLMCRGAVLPRSDWLGTDILPADKPLLTASAAECCSACANHTTSGTAPCLFWSRYTTKQGRCYLKTQATNRHHNNSMESGSLPGAPIPKPAPLPPGPTPPGPPPPQTFSVDLSSPLRPFPKPFLECVGSSHMAMGLLANDSASAPGTAAGKGEQARVGALWREHLKLVHAELNMSMFRGHGLFDDDVGIYAGVGKPINTAPLDNVRSHDVRRPCPCSHSMQKKARCCDTYMR